MGCSVNMHSPPIKTIPQVRNKSPNTFLIPRTTVCYNSLYNHGRKFDRAICLNCTLACEKPMTHSLTHKVILQPREQASSDFNNIHILGSRQGTFMQL